jgi:membrane protease YdiL (CAAX protease family)
MLNNIIRSCFLILKYAIKRKINKFGYFLTKAKSQKSRKAVQKKGFGIFGTILVILGVLYFSAIGAFLIYTNIEQVLLLDKLKKIISHNKIPSDRSELSLAFSHKDLIAEFEKIKILGGKTEAKERWEKGLNETYQMIHPSIIRQNDYYKINFEAAYQEYYLSGICPFESIESVSVPISQGSPYLRLFYVTIGMIVLFSLFTYIGLSMGEIGSIDKYYEWLAFNSLSLKYLYLFRIFENAFSNMINWFLLLPCLGYTYYALKGEWYIGVGVGLWLVWSILIGAIQVFFELYFQHYVGLKKGKTFQAICSVLGTMVMLSLLLGNSNLEIKEKIVSQLAVFESIWKWVPFFYLPFLNDLDPFAYYSVGLLLMITGLLVYLVFSFSRIFTKGGLVSNHSAYQSKRSLSNNMNLNISLSNSNPILNVEKLMLLRNKQIILTAFFTPCLLFTFYYFNFNFQMKTILDPKYISFIAFGVCSYVFLFSTFGVVQREIKSLWFIFSLPIEPHEYFLKKIWIWAGFSYFFFTVIYSFYIFTGGEVNAVFLCNFFMVLVGVGMFAIISSCIGILGLDPSETNQAQRVGPLYTNLYMYLCAFYASGLYVDSYYVKIYIAILVVTIAFGIIIKTKHVMRYYLDRSITSNELTFFESILFIFFYISILTIVQMVAFAIDNTNQYIFLSGIISSGILLVVLIFSAKNYPELKRIGVELIQFSKTNLISFKLYFYLLLSLTIAYIYMFCLKKWNLFEINNTKPEVFILQFGLYAIFLAPLVEEILFRRILFETMKRYFSPLSAVLYSSCLFAFAHPPSSFLPVFCLGCLSASLYHSNKSIHQSILLHTFYNTGVLYFYFFR